MHAYNSYGTFSFQAADLSKPIDKRIYKGTQPTCHDFNHLTATAESVSLLVGFSAGQVQLIDPIKKETSKLFNEEVIVFSHQNNAKFCVRYQFGDGALLTSLSPPSLPSLLALI